jgi:hypothetical protein
LAVFTCMAFPFCAKILRVLSGGINDHFVSFIVGCRHFGTLAVRIGLYVGLVFNCRGCGTVAAFLGIGTLLDRAKTGRGTLKNLACHFNGTFDGFRT